MNGVNAHSNVNADTAKSVGEKIPSSMIGTVATEVPRQKCPGSHYGIEVLREDWQWPSTSWSPTFISAANYRLW